MIYGNIGVGKTTVAKKLAAEKCALYISTDDWLVSLYGNNPPAEGFADRRMKLQLRLVNLVCDLLKHDLDVVFDDGFWLRSFRDYFRHCITDTSSIAQLVSVKCDANKARDRVEQRNATLDASTFYIGLNTYQILKDSCERLGPDEAHIVVDNTMTGKS